MIKFYYQEEYSDKFGAILRPVAPILITNRSKSNKFILATMYIDSGADVTTIPLKAGEVLGFAYDTKKYSICMEYQEAYRVFLRKHYLRLVIN